jgi:glycosyltransferase involved in cell wall biosynthesis
VRQGKLELSAVPILFICDFPPSNFAGGPVLLGRLFADYPPQQLTVLTGSHYFKLAPLEGRLGCQHRVFPTTNETGRWGVGRLKTLIDWLMIPVLSLVSVWLLIRTQSRVIVTVAHGHFFVAASFASSLTRKPLVLIVHDDWVSGVKKTSYVLSYLCAPLFKLISRRANHVYAVSGPMQTTLREEFGVESELQMPATDVWGPGQPEESIDIEPPGQGVHRIIYAGNRSTAMEDSLDLLVEFIKRQQLLDSGSSEWELHLYVPADEEWIEHKGWNDQRIKVQGWVTQAKLRRAILQSDLLFLPFSFREDQRGATLGSFPSKTSDYLASGKPILILAPPDSTIVRYAKEYECAEIVDKPDLELLGKALRTLRMSADRRLELGLNGQRAFFKNHDIRRQRNSFARVLASLAN